MTEEPPLRTLGVTLANGEVAELRPILRSDAPMIAEGFDHLSESSRFARFGMGRGQLSKQELDYLTDVDLVTHVAWGAIVNEEPAGVARYLTLPKEDAAEVAVTVVDRFQQLGLGTALFEALVAVARHDGLRKLTFEIDPSNEPVQTLLSRVDQRLGESGLVHGEARVAELAHSEREDDYVGLIQEYRRIREGSSGEVATALRAPEQPS